jgi:hypothetical protein
LLTITHYHTLPLLVKARLTTLFSFLFPQQLR